MKLSYKLVFAVATSNEVLIFDTEIVEPFGIIGNLHYTPLTDLSWSEDGNLLMVSSTDGFCSYVSLSSDMLGTRLEEKSSTQMATIASVEPVHQKTPGIVNILPVKRAGPAKDCDTPRRINPTLVIEEE